MTREESRSGQVAKAEMRFANCDRHYFLWRARPAATEGGRRVVITANVTAAHTNSAKQGHNIINQAAGRLLVRDINRYPVPLLPLTTTD